MSTAGLTLIYFSPTQTTRTVLEEIARGTGEEITDVIDLTLPENRAADAYNLNEGPVLIGAPVYGGRLPKDAADCFKKISAAGNPAVLTVLYGNREYEDALLELKDISSECGLFPLAAGAFIGEHSFSNEQYPIAPKRPDTGDLEKALTFGRQIAERLSENDFTKKESSLKVPGNFPYKEGVGAGAFQFIAVTDACDECGVCVSACPKDAVDEAEGYSIIEDRCIFCCACIKSCPQDARIIKECPILEKTKWLHANCAKRKEPELFF